MPVCCLACLQALEMVSHERNSMSLIYLITDGAVENERDICNVVQDFCAAKDGTPFLRISTFGIGKHLILLSLTEIINVGDLLIFFNSFLRERGVLLRKLQGLFGVW